MGREVRMVPPNWQHPKKEYYNPFKNETVEGYKPLYDKDVETAFKEWCEKYQRWVNGGGEEKMAERLDSAAGVKKEPYRSFCEWEGTPPDPELYRPAWPKGAATWWQVYETVSEGTPVTPPFATPEELVDYPATSGDFWDQRRGDGPWNRGSAEKFVKAGWAPSMIRAEDGVVREPRDQ